MVVLGVGAGILVELDATALCFADAGDLAGFDVDPAGAATGFGSTLAPFSLIRSAYEPRALKTEVEFDSTGGEVGIMLVVEGMMSA